MWPSGKSACSQGIILLVCIRSLWAWVWISISLICPLTSLNGHVVNSNFSMFTMTIWLCEDLFNEFLKFPLFFELWLNYTNCHLSIKIKTNRKNIASKFSNDYFLGGSFKILPSKPFTKPDYRCKLRKPWVYVKINLHSKHSTKITIPMVMRNEKVPTILATCLDLFDLDLYLGML